MRTSTIQQLRLARLLRYGIYLIIIGVPFYAFVTTWLGAEIGGLLWLRAWKELLLVLLIGLSMGLVFQDNRLRTTLFKSKLLQIIALFCTWSLLATIFLNRDADAAVLGLAIQLRPLLFFVVALITSFYIKVASSTLMKLVTLPAIGVVAFGLLQLFALPYDFLKHFGYQKGVTIPPYFTIDEQLDRLRIFSTLRGPNPLGVYLLAPILLVANWLRCFSRKNLLSAICYLLSATTVLYGSHSRSAWLGLAAALAVYIWLVVSPRLRLVLLAVASIGLLISGAVVYQYRQTNFVQDVVLHDNPEEGGEVSSNQGHLEALQLSLKDIKSRPLAGCGAGCAGPASVRDDDGARIAENFYLQTAQELGLIGLGLLLIIHGLTVSALFKLSTKLAYAWIAVFIGVSVASLLSHAWADDTITYLWWGVAGLMLGGSLQGSAAANARHRRKSVADSSRLAS